MTSAQDLFDLGNRTAVITGGGGMLGYQHALVLSELGANIALLDISAPGLDANLRRLKAEGASNVIVARCNITMESSVREAADEVMSAFGRVDILVNNAARNPKVEEAGSTDFSRLEAFSWKQWQDDLDVGLGGAFLCAKVFGMMMATQGSGVIVNVASELGVIAPDQRLYELEGLQPQQQPVKPVTYSVVKHGIIGLTKYLSTYWADKGVRSNTLSPGGVEAGQNEAFLRKMVDRIPMGRMSRVDDYRGAIAFLCSDASSFMNGANLIVDGGRSAW